MRRSLLLLLTAIVCAAADYRTPAGTRAASVKPEATVLPGGRLLSPFGDVYMTGSGTFGLALNEDGNALATADGGPNGFSVSLLQRAASSWDARRLITAKKKGDGDDDEDELRSVFMGLAFDGGNLYVAEGNSGRVRLVDAQTGKIRRTYNLNTAGYRDSYSGDMALDRERGLLYVIDQANFRLAVIDTRKHSVAANVRVGRLPFAIALSPDARRAYVTNIGLFEYKPLLDPVPFPAFGFPSAESRKSLGSPNVSEANSLCTIDVTDAAHPKVLGFTPTGTPIGRKADGGSSPSGVAATADAIYVSNAHNDSLSVIDPKTLRVVREMPIRFPGLERLRGVMPIGLAYEPARGWLLAAEAGINAVGVLDARTGKVLGHIPTPWFPSRVLVRDRTVYVAAAKGRGTGPNAGLSQSFQADLRRGAVSIFPLPSAEELGQHTATVTANNGFSPSPEAALPLPKELNHVLVIVKENRTYDEVFGKDGRFGPAVTPNHHEFARRWAISDNFYADSEVSVDGHHWLVGSYPDAWTETSLRASYGGQKGFRLPTSAPGRLLIAESNSSVHPEEYLEAGTLWHHLERNRISFRNFGEGFELAGVQESEGLMPTGARFQTNMPMPDPLYRNTSRTYPQFNTNIPDQYRATQLLNELRTIPELPRFLYVHLPNDHMAKPRPGDGYPQPASFVADNDYALGRILQYLSRRPEWKRMAVLITEDDAQGGVDSVDSHRTVLMVGGPYAKAGYVSHRNSSFPGLLKTVFRILGIPPLNLYDAAATDLADCFTETPDFTAFPLQPSNTAIFEPSKAREPKNPPPSEKMDDPRVLREQHQQR